MGAALIRSPFDDCSHGPLHVGNKATVLNRSDSRSSEFNWELAAESITVRIRWFGLIVGYVLVNFIEPQANRPELNAILFLGAVYALVDTWWSIRGRVFFGEWPLVISFMEAVFIGLLCYFDLGIESPFRFYYFLSLLVCAVRYSPTITYSSFALHAVSFSVLSVIPGLPGRNDFMSMFLTLVLMGWVTWASTALSSLLKSASRRMAELNDRLTENQALLEHRIAERTAELQQSQALLIQQEKQAAFGLLAAGIAHEVGNPLAAISSLVQMLNRRHQDEYTRERLQMVDDQLRRIQRTLRELVDFSRPASTERRLCDVHELVDAALNIAKYYKRKKGRRIVTRYSDRLPLLRVERDQLVQVFLNLILNGLDATEEGGTITIATRPDDGHVHVDVQDDGHGIAAADRASLFQPYFTTKSTGTGLGLFVCKDIVEKTAGGRIELASQLGERTTFTVSLPYEASPRDSETAPAIATSPEQVHAT